MEELNTKKISSSSKVPGSTKENEGKEFPIEQPHRKVEKVNFPMRSSLEKADDIWLSEPEGKLMGLSTPEPAKEEEDSGFSAAMTTPEPAKEEEDSTDAKASRSSKWSLEPESQARWIARTSEEVSSSRAMASQMFEVSSSRKFQLLLQSVPFKKITNTKYVIRIFWTVACLEIMRLVTTLFFSL